MVAASPFSSFLFVRPGHVLNTPQALLLLKNHILIADPERPIEIVMHAEECDRDLVPLGSQGILENLLAVVQDKADDPRALFVISFRAQHLVERAEARVDAPSKHRLLEGRIGLYDGVSHLVGHLQKVELSGGEDAVDDGIHVVHVVIFGRVAHGDPFAALHDQRIGRADIFKDLALGISDRVEQALVVKLGPGGGVDHVVIEKASQTLLDGHALVALAPVILDRAVVEFCHVLADGHARAVLSMRPYRYSM